MMLKKIFFIVIFPLLSIVLFIFISAGAIFIHYADNAEASQKDMPITSNGQCKYISKSDDVVFDERTEAIRNEMSSKVGEYYLNIAMAMYQNDDTLSVDDIANEINTWESTENIAVNLQNFKYEHKYVEWLKNNNEEHSLAMSKKYYSTLENVSNNRIFVYYLDVLSLINKDCKPINATGDWITPLEKPFVITQEYGVNHIYGDLHLGIDLSKGYGETVRAVIDGEIVDTANTCPSNGGYLGNTCNYGMGNYIKEKITVDEQDIYIVYMHLQESNVIVGDLVVSGEAIGKQGNSGNSTGSHLHLEFRKKEALGTSIEETYDPHEFIDFN